MERYNINTVFFQVRPANDAFYRSEYNAWSMFLLGDGRDPGWDPLEWMIEETHKRGMEFHAWLNPYRVSASTMTPNPDQTVEEMKMVLYSVSSTNKWRVKILKPTLSKSY